MADLFSVNESSQLSYHNLLSSLPLILSQDVTYIFLIENQYFHFHCFTLFSCRLVTVNLLCSAVCPCIFTTDLILYYLSIPVITLTQEGICCIFPSLNPFLILLHPDLCSLSLISVHCNTRAFLLACFQLFFFLFNIFILCILLLFLILLEYSCFTMLS